MKAIVYDEYGGPDVLRLSEISVPKPQKGEVLIRVRAVETTKSDCEMRRMRFAVKWFVPFLRLALGVTKPKRKVLGAYFSGVVETLGEEATRFSVGDEIFGTAQLRFGAYAEFLTVPERYTLAKKPQNIGFEEAAGVPLGGLNALHFLNKLQVQEGQRVLINGAGGSIGSFGVQLAKAKGAHVTAVDAPHKEEALRQMGVDDFVDYTKRDFADEGAVFDAVFDMVPGSSYKKCLSVLKDGGRYVTANPTLLRMLRAFLTSLFSNKKTSFAFAGETQGELDELARMLEAGEIRVPVDQVFPLHRAHEAHVRVENEERTGVVVLRVA